MKVVKLIVLDLFTLLALRTVLLIKCTFCFLIKYHFYVYHTTHSKILWYISQLYFASRIQDTVDKYNDSKYISLDIFLSKSNSILNLQNIFYAKQKKLFLKPIKLQFCQCLKLFMI